MAIRVIPTKTIFVCDGCGKEVDSDHPLRLDRPKYWASLRVEADAYDFQGQAVADGSVRLLLCDECKTVVTEAVREALKERKK